MKKLSKVISLSLAAAMLVCMPAMAAESPSRSSSSNRNSGMSEAEVREAAVEASLARAAEADAAAAEASGIPMAITVTAASEKKTVGEYANNAVAELPGIPNVVPVSQGGNVIINGAPSNQTFSVLKPADGAISVAKTYASNIGGTVLNVVKVNASVGFNTATVNFYMPGVTAGNNIKVVQLIDGQWSDVSVAEVRADHVVVDMTSLGTLAFIEVQ
ncbi:MAG: hypothetical protein K2N43_05095 [Lachnospiraceae bacterium]|nr:hypothetical protein [Lachnospiraceae bacterium]